MKELQQRRFATQAALEKWLATQPPDAPGVWLVIAKKDSGIRSVTQKQAVEAGLCWGWIDGQALSIDEAEYAIRFTPRRARSRWSKINCASAEALIAAGRVQPPGLAEIARARSDGRWEAAYDSPKNIQVPADLEEALDAEPAARAFFATLDAQNRYAVLYRIHDAKRADTRERRIATFVAMLARGEKIYPK